MGISDELSRIQTARNTIRTKLVELGLAESTANITTCAGAVNGITNQGAVSATVQEGDTYTIPQGYHNGAGTVSGVSGGGNYSLQSKTVTPTKNQQSITPDSGYYGLSDVTVKAIPENYQDTSSVTATAPDVLVGKVIVTADGTVTTGTMPNNGTVAETLTVSKKSYTIPKGYHSGTGSVSITTETKSVTPTEASQEITPTTGSLISSVTVSAIPLKYVDLTEATATAEQVLAGSKIGVLTKDAGGNITGSEIVSGTMANNGALALSIDGLNSTSTAIPKGYHDGTGTVSLTNDVLTALQAI